ncbi:hypothetical protein LX36DRAFT_649389 [Colletotrichum falcatum]|nr:hypothetical protein LX36DRAFT_649389 [Colletotrichum falcatum]
MTVRRTVVRVRQRAREEDEEEEEEEEEEEGMAVNRLAVAASWPMVQRRAHDECSSPPPSPGSRTWRRS